MTKATQAKCMQTRQDFWLSETMMTDFAGKNRSVDVLDYVRLRRLGLVEAVVVVAAAVVASVR